MHSYMKTFGLFVASLFWPFVVMTIYLPLSRWFGRPVEGQSDWIALAFSVGLGILCLGVCDTPIWVRMSVAMLYAVSMFNLLFMFALYFVCTVFNDCL